MFRDEGSERLKIVVSGEELEDCGTKGNTETGRGIGSVPLFGRLPSPVEGEGVWTQGCTEGVFRYGLGRGCRSGFVWDTSTMITVTDDTRAQ